MRVSIFEFRVARFETIKLRWNTCLLRSVPINGNNSHSVTAYLHFVDGESGLLLRDVSFLGGFASYAFCYRHSHLGSGYGPGRFLWSDPCGEINVSNAHVVQAEPSVHYRDPTSYIREKLKRYCLSYESEQHLVFFQPVVHLLHLHYTQKRITRFFF